MILVSWIVFLLCVATALSANNRREPEHLNNYWAVLVAGSNNWTRYQDQANICRAYKSLIENGIPKSRIITFMYDDIAFNPLNPEPGVIKSEPNGTNVYHGVPIDYKGDDVRKDVFLWVLQGRKYKVKNIGSKRVVLSYQRDNILIYYAGIGGEDFVEFPGSVMAITAGGSDENNLGTWCNTSIQPCRAGLFSYTWISSAENATNATSVFNHFDEVQKLVAKTGKQHPQLYGDRKIGNLPITDFIGYMRNEIRFKNSLYEKDTIIPKNVSYQLTGDENKLNPYTV